MVDDGQGRYLTGKLLIAMPNMEDVRFHRAVVFVCAHDAGGAMGLVINHKMPNIRFGELIRQLKFDSDINVDIGKLNFPIMYGGPVESARGFILHSGDFISSDTMKISDTYGITGTISALEEIIRGTGPKDMVFALGYAGWNAGQLDAEIQQNAWLVVDSDYDLVFENEPEQKWVRAINKLGIDPAMLSNIAGTA